MVSFDERSSGDKTYVSKGALPRKVISIIRTTQRNNIELTGIADNKANVLLSLNAIMLTIVVPLVSAYSQWIKDTYLYLPLSVLLVTCFTTIYYSTKVLQPSDFNQPRDTDSPSPFFFGNFYKMESKEYYKHLQIGLSNPDLIKEHLAQDLYYIGKRLGQKMSWIRFAFKIFTGGIFLSMIMTAIVLFFND